MSDARIFIIEALQRVADGGDITEDELDAAIPDPFALDAAEKRGWEQLSHWADDGDIREDDAQYATMKRRWMRDEAALLSGYSADEVQRGKIDARQVTFRVGTMMVLAIAAAYLLLS